MRFIIIISIYFFHIMNYEFLIHSLFRNWKIKGKLNRRIAYQLLRLNIGEI